MNIHNLALKLSGLISVVLVVSLLSGCAPMTRTSKLMAVSVGAPTSPPPGKSLVCIHRPKNGMGWKLYTSIWDGTKLVADLGNRHSVAYVCDPGQHYFVNLSVEETGCIDAQLLPDQTYDLWVQGGYGFWIASFKLKPVQQDAKGRQLVTKWSASDRWVETSPQAAAYEQANQDRVAKVIEEFRSGSRHPKLQQMAPDDHR